jgi:hypothetical protein
MSGIYRVHEALPLTSMIVADYAEDLSGCSFFITHPIKSFMVQASSATEKREWLRDIQWTIQDSTKRMHESNAAAEQVRAFYSKYNVEKLEDLDYLMSKYKGRELILLEKLELQYGKPGACAPSQALEALSVLSPVPVLNSVSELTVDTAAVVTKHNFISRINDQQKEISEVGKTVLSILSAPTPRETATCTPFQEIIVTKSAVYDI